MRRIRWHRRFAADSPLEGDGFEPSVPRERDNAFRASPSDLAFPMRERDRGFESCSLQQRVSLSAASAFEGREPRLSARVWAAGLATRSAETRRAFQFAPTCGNISVGPYSSTAVPLMWSARMPTPIPTKSGLPRFNVRQIFEFGSGSGKAEHGALIV